MKSRTVKHKRSTRKRERHQYAGTPPMSFFKTNASLATPMKKSHSKSRKKPREKRLARWELAKLNRVKEAEVYEAITKNYRIQNANRARSLGPNGFGLLKDVSEYTKPRIGIEYTDGLPRLKRDKKSGNFIWYALDDIYYEHPVTPPTKM